MNKKLKIKIVGESPRSIFLAYLFAKFNFDIYLYDFSINYQSKIDDEIISFTNYSKNLLIKFGIWREFKDISYSFNSLFIKDNLISKQLLFQRKNLSNNNINTIGWVVKYSDMRNLLMTKLINIENITFVTNNQLIDQHFDFELNFNSFDKIYNLLKLRLSIFKSIDEQILIFKVYLRGNVDKRLYEINTTKGLLVFTPIEKNIYQITWKNNSLISKIGYPFSKSLLLDNLTTLLPSDLKIDQIIDEIKLFYVNNHTPTCIIKRNLFYFNERKFKSNPLYDFNFDTYIRNIYSMFKFFENNKYKNYMIFRKLKSYYLLKNYFKFRINIYF